VCRKKNEKISWQAVDKSGQPIEQEFSLRFRKADSILEGEDAVGPGSKCNESRKGSLKCRVRGDASEGEYKYVVQVDNTECPVLDPRIYVR